MTNDLKKFEQGRKNNIANTIGNNLRLGVEELGRAVGSSQKSSGSSNQLSKNQISTELDKYETGMIERHKNKN